MNDVRFRRHMADSPVCSRCNETNETVWLTHSYSDIILAAPRTSFAECFAWIVEKSDAEALAVICASLWACWYGRNSIIMDNSQCDFVQLSTAFVKMTHDYQVYMSGCYC